MKIWCEKKGGHRCLIDAWLPLSKLVQLIFWLFSCTLCVLADMLSTLCWQPHTSDFARHGTRLRSSCPFIWSYSYALIRGGFRLDCFIHLCECLSTLWGARQHRFHIKLCETESTIADQSAQLRSHSNIMELIPFRRMLNAHYKVICWDGEVQCVQTRLICENTT